MNKPVSAHDMIFLMYVSSDSRTIEQNGEMLRSWTLSDLKTKTGTQLSTAINENVSSLIAFWHLFPSINSDVIAELLCKLTGEEYDDSTIGILIDTLGDRTPNFKCNKCQKLVVYQGQIDNFGSMMKWLKFREEIQCLCDSCRTRQTGKQWYSNYLKSPHWQHVRADALQRAKFSCQICNSKKSLQVHHRTYERVGSELPEDVIVLCDSCHGLFHKGGKLAK